MSGAFKHLARDGSFYQFAYGHRYGHRCPVPQKILRLLGLEAKHIGRALLNFPPASVYRICRRQLQMSVAALLPRFAESRQSAKDLGSDR